jgi:methyltransferase (TIGR00027 family)
MREGEASITACRVAARRLTFERAPAAYGDPESDERLSRDVAGSVGVDSTGWMTDYLAARTAFFDRVVVGAVDRGVSQVVIAAAGYDGRALRYAKPGVRWFEVDHPDTQADKRSRVERLGIDTGHIAFVAADFSVDDVAGGLIAAGHDAAAASLFLCEGVAIYLERPVLESLLRQLRAAAGEGSRLAVSLSLNATSAAHAVRRAAFRRAVAAMGEPARTVLSTDELDALLRSTGWQILESVGSERGRRSGLLLLEPRPVS